MKTRSRRRAVTAEALADAISGVAEEFQGSTRVRLLEFLQMLASSRPEAALKCAENAVGILHQLSRSQQEVFLVGTTSLANLPDAAAEFFLGCGDLLHNLDSDDLRAWVEHGHDLGRRNPEAAVAFFRQESRASITLLRKLRTSVHLTEVMRLLQLYCTAIAGKPLGVKNTGEAPSTLVRAGHLFPLTDGKTIFLPERLNKHSTREENFAEYKVFAAHQAGYIEFETFTLDVDALLDHPGFAAFASRAGAVESDRIASHYELFFRLFDDMRLAGDIFFAVEDGRIDNRLREKYRGLAAALEKVALASLESRPPPSSLPLREALVESLIRLSVSGRIEELLPDTILPLYRHICRLFSRVLNPNSTVTDSAVITARIYSILSALPNLALETESCCSAVQEMDESLTEDLRKGGRREDGTAPPLVAGVADQADSGQPYGPAMPVLFRGQTRPELVQLETAIDLLRDAIADAEEMGRPLTSEMLQELLRRGVKIEISGMTSKELADATGLFITDLKGVFQERVRELSPDEKKKFSKLLQQATVVKSEEPDGGRVFYYDEWDYLIGDYRPRWCRLREMTTEDGPAEIVAQIRKENASLIMTTRRHFQRIRPEMLSRVKRLRSGEEIEMDHAIEAVVDRRSGRTPSDRIYQKRERRTRDVATAFLLDLSASTDEWIVEDPGSRRDIPASSSQRELFKFFSKRSATESGDPSVFSTGTKRVIDIEREALVIMSEALESLDDQYAIYGFSGYGRDNVELFPIKEFSERYSEQTRRRIGGLKPRKSTRMGPAIRHTLDKLAGTGCRLKVLILLSDGYPQDFDYGPDRTSRDYGLHDTMIALREARRMNVHAFCVTVDQAGNDYLHEMCGGENYLVVRRPGALPKILPRIYRGLTV